MAPFKSHGRGRLVLKGTFAGIRIERSSGTDDPKMLKALREMLTVLSQGGRLDLVRAVALRIFRPLELYEHYRIGDWKSLPTPEQMRPLKPTLEAWRDSQKNKHTKKAAKAQVKRILEHAVTDAAMMDLTAALTRYRIVCEDLSQGQMFAHVKAAALAVVRTTPGFGRHSPLWLAISAVPSLGYDPKRQPNPQRPPAAWAIAQALGGDRGREWWEMCCTGMNPDEYFARKWSMQDGRLHVAGTKRAARKRVVPLLLDRMEGPTISQQMFEIRVRESGFGITPMDARRSFAVWLAELEIPENRQQAYMGHGPRTMTQHYQRVKSQYLDEDEARLRALIGGLSGGTIPTFAGKTE
jgi:hypothetical protein